MVYNTYLLASGSTSGATCSGTIFQTYYSPNNVPFGPTVAEYLYLDTALTNPVPDAWYGDPNGVYVGKASYEVTGGSGQITTKKPCP